VTFHGVQVDDRKTELFRQAEIFCFPTYFESENLSVAVLEAMRHSLPVVATAWRGLIDVVEDGITGYLVPVRDVRATADRLAALLADPELAGALGAAGRRVYEREYTVDVFCQRIEAALVEVAAQGRAGRHRWRSRFPRYCQGSLGPRQSQSPRQPPDE
jgi:glycosyltransferase involved in cell wall biosynthesis